MRQKRVWSVGPKPVDQKMKNDRVGIFTQMDKNCKAEKMIRSKNIVSCSLHEPLVHMMKKVLFSSF